MTSPAPPAEPGGELAYISDRLGDLYAKYYDQMDGTDREALSKARIALERLIEAAGDDPGPVVVVLGDDDSSAGFFRSLRRRPLTAKSGGRFALPASAARRLHASSGYFPGGQRRTGPTPWEGCRPPALPEQEDRQCTV